MATSCRECSERKESDSGNDFSNNRDAAAALVGSLGLIPSINAGDNFVMGEPYVPRFSAGFIIDAFLHF